MKLFMKALLLLLMTTTSWCNTNFSFKDLKAIKKSCSSRGTCQSGRVNRLDPEPLNCFCDSLCINYSDCCLVAKTYEPSLMKENNDKFECVNLFPVGYFYMKGTCKNKDHEASKLCHRAKPESLAMTFHSDPFLDTPVTSVASDITYKNLYCALCNDESIMNIRIWQAQIRCPQSDALGEPFIKENLQFINNSWGILNLENKFETCDIFPAVVDTVSRKVRECEPHINTCSLDWNDQRVENLCQSYTTLVFGSFNYTLGEQDIRRLSSILDTDIPVGIYAFKNYHCAICNHVYPEDLTCNTRDTRYLTPPYLVSFSVLFDFGEKMDHCGEDQIWDPFSKNCRQVVCAKYSSEKCLGNVVANNATNSTTIIHDRNNSTKFLDDNSCNKVFFNQSEFNMREDGTISISSIRETFEEEHFHFLDDGVVVCLPSQYSSLMGWLTFIGLGLSCICILIHLVVFMMVPELKNLSGKNLASLCLALLIAFSCFLASTMIPTDNCLTLASIMYYSFLASFAWMNVMAFDIWITLQRTTTQLRLTGGKQRKKFFFYCLYAWVLPAAALAIVLYIDFEQPAVIPPTLYPGLGSRLCWFSQKNSILVYFAAPLAIIMSFNLGFFLHSVYMVLMTKQNSSISQSKEIQLKLYLRLALLMGLSWIGGILGGYLQNEYLWYVFILLNAFQGLFILLGFTCTQKVRKALFTAPKSKADKQDSNTGNTSSISTKSSSLPSP